MGVAILCFGAAEAPTGPGLSANPDGAASVVVVPTLFHQLKVAGLLLSGPSHAGRLLGR